MKAQRQLQNVKFFVIGGNPIVRSEFAAVLPNFEVICTKDVQSEIQALQNDMTVTVFPVKAPSGKQAKKPGTILSKISVQEYINSYKNSFKKIAIITMRPSKEVQEVCNKNDWIFIGNDYQVAQKAGSKKLFQKILHEQNIQTTATLTTLQDLTNNQEKYLKVYNNHMVVQMTEKSDGGHGTFFCIKGEDCIQKIKERMDTWKDELGPDPTITIDYFVAGDEISVSGCITKVGVFTAEPQQQLIDIPELVWGKSDGTGIFCGHDWVIDIDNTTQEQVIEITRKIGDELQKMGVRGFYGVDFIVDKVTRRVVPLEANVRLTGVYPTFMDVQLLNNEVSLGLLHVLEFLNTEMEVISLESKTNYSSRVGAQMLLFNQSNHNIEIKKTLLAGIYSYKNMKYLRPGYHLTELNDDEFLIVDGVPNKGDIYSANRKLCKVISRKQLLAVGHTLTPYASVIVEYIYDQIYNSIL